MKYRAVLSDMDGLLLDTERVSLECWTKASEETGISFPKEVFIGMIGRSPESSYEHALEQLGPEFPYWELRARKTELVQGYVETKGLPLKAGAFELISSLKKADIPVAVATSTHYELAKSHLTHAGILPLLKGLVGSDLVENGKPAPDLYLAGAKLLGVKPEECVVLEDSPAGCEAGLAAGCAVLAVPDLVVLSDEIQQAVHGVYGSLAQAGEEVFRLIDRGS